MLWNDNNRQLLKAAEKGYYDKLVKYLDEGANINIKDKRNRTPLIIASEKNNIDIVIKLSLDKRIEIDAMDSSGQNALMKAAEKGHYEIVELLIAAGADINAKDKHRKTALSLASRKGHTNVVKLLLAKGAVTYTARTVIFELMEKGVRTLIEKFLK